MISQYAFLAVVLIVSLLSVPLIGNKADYEARRADIYAENFLKYRDAVREFMAKKPGYDGAISSGSLDLPPQYENLGWNSEANTGTAYVYGDLNSGGLRHAIENMDQPINLGVKEGGNLISPVYGDTGISVPDFVAPGDVVAVIQNTS